jgi:predicted O-methyltransferase YrrM
MMYADDLQGLSVRRLSSVVSRVKEFSRRVFFRDRILVKDSPENWHVLFIENLASLLKPRVYVELGLYQCELFNRIVPHSSSLIGVDIDPKAGNWMAKSDKASFVCKTTDDFAVGFKENPVAIDMLFIDADHSKEAVLKDFWNFFPFITPQGFIILHDTYPKNHSYTQSGYCGDAYKAIDELSRHGEIFEMVTVPVHPGLTLCRKRKTQLSWTETGV